VLQQQIQQPNIHLIIAVLAKDLMVGCSSINCYKFDECSKVLSIKEYQEGT
jgi:hypothetical protein